jgi:NADH dehydrogenase [ubiquinone] 1 alpha subcomplex assembly factor 7
MARKTRNVSDDTPEAFAARLVARTRAQGPISIADYMDEVARFYYGGRDPFGTGGDFITAPEISQVFGELIGLWCAELWQRFGAPDPVLLVELGPGRGTLMADALRATRHVPGFTTAARLHLIERSPRLRALQAEKLAAHAPHFHDDIARLPPGPMLLIANEFFDALPIRQFERHAGAWHERLVATEESRLALVRDQQAAREHLGDGDEGAIKELCPGALRITQDMARRITREGGAAVMIDYGYYPSAYGDTLQAVRGHRYASVVDSPGSADLTAHVDFQAVAHAAKLGGAQVYGPVTQGGFLASLGIAAREAALLKTATPAQQETIRAGCRRLVDPAEMGALFKVLALGQPGGAVPEGFGATR